MHQISPVYALLLWRHFDRAGLPARALLDGTELDINTLRNSNEIPAFFFC